MACLNKFTLFNYDYLYSVFENFNSIIFFYTFLALIGVKYYSSLPELLFMSASMFDSISDSVSIFMFDSMLDSMPDSMLDSMIDSMFDSMFDAMSDSMSIFSMF